MTAIHDDINPKFVHFSPVAAQELAGGALPPARLAAHVDEAIRAFCAQVENPATLTFGEPIVLEQLTPLTAAGTIRIDLWLESLDETSCTYGFLCSSANGCAAYARGERTVTKPDETFRRTSADLLRDLHAFA